MSRAKVIENFHDVRIILGKMILADGNATWRRKKADGARLFNVTSYQPKR